MLAGLPGCGKTTLTEKLKRESDRETIVISSDKIREEFYGSEDVQGDSQEVFAEMSRRTVAALKEGKDVVYDACNINSKRRKAFLSTLTKFSCEKICVICATPYQECQKRNSQRKRVVPEEAIRRMYMQWNTPCYYEGWDQIQIYFAEGAKGLLGTPEAFVEKLIDYQQDTPYHLETLGVHMKRAYEYLLEKNACEKDSNLAIAALIHDCGKPFTKVFSDSKGNATEIAHYYQHQCTGAYDAMFFDFGDKTTEDVLEIAALIFLHMIPFNWKEEKTAEKSRKLWGDKLYQKVCLLHEADEAACVRGEI